LKRAILCGHVGECGILEIHSENLREIVCEKRITDARSESSATTFLKCAIPCGKKRAILCGHVGECGILEIYSENRREIDCGKRITDARSESSATTFLKCAIPCGHVGELIYK